MRAAVLMLLIAGAARAEDPRLWPAWEPPSRKETALLGAAEVLILADVLQSLDSFKNHAGWEANPLLPRHPSTEAMWAVGASVGLGIALLWYFLPSPWRDVAPGATVLIEIPNVTHNAVIGLRFSL